MNRYRRDSSWRQPGDGRVVIAGSPLRLFRVSAGGAQVLSAATDGEQPPTAIVRQMLDRFVDAGALHPIHESGPYTADDVTVVTPAFGELPTITDGLRRVIVDDGSEPPLRLPATLDDSAPDVRILRLSTNQGPAAARNAGLALVTTPLVAFVDVDVEPDAEWLAPLLAHFADERVALVAPRVVGARGRGRIAAYERRHTPLDLGAAPARVAAGTRVSYVPAAAVVARTAVLREMGGFDAAMRVGEDVDLVWRLAEHGHRCRYETASQVQHRPRRSWRGLVQQRMGYGRSAAALATRHRGALAPVRMSGWSAGVWVLAALRRPWLALGVAVGTTVALQRKLRDVPARESARLAALGHLAAGRQLANAVTRVWWPVAVMIAVFVPKARLPLAAAVVAPVVADAVRQRSITPLCDAPTVLVDEMAYGAGLWLGVLDDREIGPLIPAFTTWPRRGDG